MASSANRSEESTALGDQIQRLQPPPSKLQSGLSPPLSPQLRYFLNRKQPRIPVPPPPSSRTFPPIPPETLALLASGSYVKVPSKWCPENRLWSRDLYLSRTSLLKKMNHQRILYRTPIPSLRPIAIGIEALGSPIDFWVTMPIIPLPIGLKNPDLPELKNVSLDESQGISIAYATGPIIPTRYTLNQRTGYGGEPDYDGLPFEWVRNASGTKFLGRSSLMSLNIKHITGFVECPTCGLIYCLGCLVPTRIDMISIKRNPIGNNFMIHGSGGVFRCRCVDDSSNGRIIPVRTFISDDLNKINWGFLFFWGGIENCTVDQLRYYCKQKKFEPISDVKVQLLFTVVSSICVQITERLPV